MSTAIPDRKHAVITGGASGLGRAIALRLARDGWYIAVADVNEAGSQETLRQIQAAGGDGHTEHLDVSQRDEWTQLRSRLEAAWPSIDLLVNNAGVSGAGEIGQFSLDDWQWLLGINLMGTIYGCHTFVDWLKRNPRGGAIINTASLAALISAPTMAAYNVAKSGIVSLSETLYAEVAKHNVSVTVLCPSFFQTPLLENSRMYTDDQQRIAANSMRNASFTADYVAQAALRAMRRKFLYVVVPAKGRIWWRIKRFIPFEFMWFLGKRYAKGLPDSL
ncbi:MAG TPA: SDR family NAD(P)-dependent oxidoreductase [Pirellulales bacterium]|jgi:NAD(P)-dependent dehydrogenase (short-subunit alcohol dehydrogenase family)|nr:SDR family NAD(P)-dependent oxidoreductase [Pirellulales bacterium]